MNTVKLTIGAFAACAAGLVAGFAVDPVMLQPEWPDWRERYRMVTRGSAVPTQDGQPVYFSPTYLPGPAFDEREAPQVAWYDPEVDLQASYQLQQPLPDATLERPVYHSAAFDETSYREGQAAVADALVKTEAIAVPAPAQAEVVAPAPDAAPAPRDDAPLADEPTVEVYPAG